MLKVDVYLITEKQQQKILLAHNCLHKAINYKKQNFDEEIQFDLCHQSKEVANCVLSSIIIYIHNIDIQIFIYTS